MGCCQSVHDHQVQAGAITQGCDQGAAQTTKELLGKLGLTTRAEVRFACRNLPKKDATSKSDPIAVLYQSGTTGVTEWKEVGRTDMVANTHDPEFIRPVLVTYNPDSQQPMRVVVYDVDKISKKMEQLSDYIGEAEFVLSDLMGSPSKTLELPLLDVEGGQQLPEGCAVTLRAEVMANRDEVVRLAFSAGALPKKDMMSQSDPFLRVLKQREEGDWVPVFKTEVRMNNPAPVWKPIEVDIRQLCSGDEQRLLKLEVWDYKNNGAHHLIGECYSSLAQLKVLAQGPATAAKNMDLVDPNPDPKKAQAAAAQDGKGVKSGVLTVRQVVVRPGPSFRQQMNGCCAGW